MSWTEKYWDALDQLYWSPPHLGLNSINKKHWGDDAETITIPRSMVSADGALYTRKGTSAYNAKRRRALEETLNHIFDITFAIAPDHVVRNLFLRRIGLEDDGPIERLGREVQTRYDWGRTNVTQQDMLLTTPSSIVGVELKLGSRTWDIQVLKYLTLMVLEEQLTGPRDDLALLFVTPDSDPTNLWADCRADGGTLPAGWIEKCSSAKLSSKLARILHENRPSFEAAASRLRLDHMSWNDLVSGCVALQQGLDLVRPGDETLGRLLNGFVHAVRAHSGTNCMPA